MNRTSLLPLLAALALGAGACQKQPTEAEIRALLFAWKVCKHVKSNAIVYASADRTLGIGAFSGVKPQRDDLDEPDGGSEAAGQLDSAHGDAHGHAVIDQPDDDLASGGVGVAGASQRRRRALMVRDVVNCRP